MQEWGIGGRLPTAGASCEILPWRQAPVFLLARVASWSARIFFLLRKERKRLAKERKRTRETPGFPLRILSLQRGRGPSDTSGGSSLAALIWSRVLTGFCEHSLSGLRLRPGLIRIRRSSCRAANFRSCPAKSKFPLEISFRGGLRFARWGPSPHRSSHRKDFSRGKVPCGGREGKLATRQRDCGTIQQTGNLLPARKRVLTIFVSTL